MAVSKILKPRKIQTLVVNDTTNQNGDLEIPINRTQYALLSAVPNRSAGEPYYSSYYNILLNGAWGTGGNYGAKIVSDSMANIANTKVTFTVYYTSIN